MSAHPSLPAGLPSIARAKLPATYSAAKQALAECSRLDECQQWADQAEALASYAKQSEDDTLRKMCDRIQARAIRRCGELLKQIEPGKGGRPAKTQDGADPSYRGPFRMHSQFDQPLTRQEAAERAGLSERQRKTALRVANVPESEFDAAVESDSPPTVTRLAEMGKNPFRDEQVKRVRMEVRLESVLREFARFEQVLDWAELTNIDSLQLAAACDKYSKLLKEISKCIRSKT